MADPSGCPNQQLLERFALGETNDNEAQTVERHLTDCDRCLETLHALRGDNTLTTALRAQKAASVPPDDPALCAQIERLRQLPDAFDATQGGGSADASDSLDFLAPPEGPGEIGRLAHYRVRKVLGEGGMGMVFLADDTQLERPVPLKVMKPELAKNPTYRQRFLREARATAALHNDHIVTIFQVGEDRGVAFLATEFLKGEPLDRWLDRGRKPSLPQILRTERELARGLMTAHERGLIHRDIKPGNIWLEAPAGRVKILDFGLARSQIDNVNITQSGAIVGTPAYMAPEQARGDKLDARSDLFSLGCVLYRLCAGQSPFRGANTMAVLSSLALDTPKPVHTINPAVPQALSELIDRLLAKDPEDRPASAEEVVKAIQAIERGLAGQAAQAGSAAQPAAGLEQTEAGAAPLVAKRQPAGKVGPAEPSVPSTSPAGRGSSRRRWPLLVGGGAFLIALAFAAPIILRITRKDGTKQDIPLNPGDRIEIVQQQPAAQQPPAQPSGPSPFDALRPEDIPVDGLSAAGGGDPAKAPADLVGVFGTAKAGSWIGTLFVSPDGRRVYPAGKAAMRILDAATGKDFGKLSPNLGRVAGISTYYAHTRDGNRIACANEATGVTIVNPTTGTEQITFARREGDGFGGLAFRPDGERLALVHGPDRQSRKVEIWDAVRGEMLRTLDGHGDAVELVAYSADGARLATASADATIKIWDPESGKELRSIPTAVKTKFLGLWFSPDGTEIGLSVYWGFQTWDVATGAQRLRMPGVGVVCLSPDGKWLATWAKSDKQLCLRESGTGKVQRTWTLPAEVNVIAFAPDGRHLLTGTGVGVGVICVLRLAPPAARSE